MELLETRVRNYKSINDTGWVEIDDMTCLIGKNESGKTAFMEAIGRLNPAYGEGTFTPYDDYPRHRWPEYKDRHDDDPDPAVSARFRLEEDEKQRLAAETEAATDDVEGSDLLVTKTYANELRWELTPTDGEGSPERIDGAGEVLTGDLPEFRYLGEYTTLDPEIDVEAFRDRLGTDAATASDRVFHSLLSVAGIDPETLGEGDSEGMLTELEAASSEITDAVTRYWSQADDLRVHIRGSDGGDTLSLRVESPNHGVSVGFGQRSRGLRWFFSTICTISDLRAADRDQVLLLDEPGLHLHPKAKREFREFLDAEFAAEQTLVYSTHSPFMIDTDRAHRTKLLEKNHEAEGTELKSPGEADSYTQFPLRSVFELDVMETIISRSRLLLVEDETAYTYLYNVSELLEDTDTDGIDYRWTVLPIGTTENVGTVRELFDVTDREVAVFQERTSGGRAMPDDVTLTAVGAHTDVRGDATIEDVLSVSFYLELVSRAYAGALSEQPELPDRITDGTLGASERPIVERVAAYFEANDIADGAFDRSVPAEYLQRNREEFVDALDMETKRTFGALARDLNATLEDIDRGSRRSRSFLGSLFGN